MTETTSVEMAYDYTELLKCSEITEAACFGSFEISPNPQAGRYKFDKQPIDIEPLKRKEGGKGRSISIYTHGKEGSADHIGNDPKSKQCKHAICIGAKYITFSISIGSVIP